MRIPPILLGLTLAAAPLSAQDAPVVGFDDGAQGWSINGQDVITPTGGNPAEFIRWPDPVDTFGISARTSTNAAFLGDYTAKGEVTLGLDVRVNFIQFFGSPVPRELVVVLFDDDPFGAAPPAQVWASLGVLSGTGMPWTRFEAEVTDVFSDTLPAGWNGAGDEDPDTFEPILPAGRTWTNVLQGVDRVEFTTFVPGFFFGFTNFDVGVDNVSIVAAENAWSDAGSALAGVTGEPLMTGDGSAAPGSSNAITVSNGAPDATFALFVGVTAANLPFKGGTLVPQPQLVVTGDSGAAGGFAFDLVMPASAPSGAELWMQTGFADGAAVAGVSLSNAILGVVP